jgi:3-oxo-5-alpha-steroid 4-dehydrogenase 1
VRARAEHEDREVDAVTRAGIRYKSTIMLRDAHSWLVLTEFVLAILTFLSLLFITAPYGRHAREGWGPTLSPRVAWVVMESPAVLLWAAFFFAGEHRAAPGSLALLALWMTHYVYRTFIYPTRIKESARRTPLVIALTAVAFNTLNAAVNAGQVSHVRAYDADWLRDPRFIVGVLVFALGYWINHQSDGILLSLRKPGETGYKIPYGGMYRWISCPNYFGELLEWVGWSIATWSLAGLSFAVYTAANLVPRALDNHRWYQQKFEDYPKERRAIIPFLL